MSVAFNDGVALARVNLREDAAKLKPQDWIYFAEQARMHISRDRPRERLIDIAATGTKNYTLTGVVTGWITRFSKIRRIEFPSGKEPPVYLKEDAWQVYKPSTDSEQLKFLKETPGTGATIRLTFTSRHDLDPTTSTIDDDDKSLIALLLAHYAALALSADFLKANRSNLPNDSVDFSQKSEDMMDLANSLLKKYADLISGKTPEVKSYVTMYKDFDMKTRDESPFIIHPEDGR